MSFQSISAEKIAALLQTALTRGEKETAAQLAQILSDELSVQPKADPIPLPLREDNCDWQTKNHSKRWKPRNPAQAAIRRTFLNHAKVGQVITFDELCNRYQQNEGPLLLGVDVDPKQAPWRREVSNVLLMWKRLGIVSKTMPDGSRVEKGKHYVVKMP